MLLQDISQEEQDRKFIKWWHKHDQDMSGHVTMDEFSTWWVHQSDRQLQAASHLDWSKAERELASDLLLDADGDIADGDKASTRQLIDVLCDVARRIAQAYSEGEGDRQSG